MHYRLIVASIGLATVVAIASANAADMYHAPAAGGYKDDFVPAATWTGFYAGVNGGYAFDAQNTHGGVDDNGGFGGGQIGYNWQGVWHPNLVIGLEADIQGAGIGNSGIATLERSGDAAEHNISIDYFGTVRGRIGYAQGPLLIYGTGGFAYGGVNNRFHDLVTGTSFSSDKTQTGYAAGGGVEYKFASAWSFKVEYQYINLDHDNAVSATGRFITTKDSELNTVRAGINYHFGSTYEPLK